MHLRYDEDLIEEAVFLCASRKSLPGLQLARFHRERERLYRILDPDQRNEGFFKLHLEWFREWGLEAGISGLLAEFPRLTRQVEIFALRKARAAKEEAAELFVRDSGAPNAVVALRPERFLNQTGLSDFLRHELTHLEDMLNPEFGYQPELEAAGGTPAQRRLPYERYRLLWDITIDGRLAARGHTPAAGRERHWTAFSRAYCFLPEPGRGWLFDQLWTEAQPRHEALAKLACDPRGLGQIAQAVPGAPCPLCGFPTFDWVEPQRVSPALEARIVSEFPQWSPNQSLCGRCFHVYEVALRSSASGVGSINHQPSTINRA